MHDTKSEALQDAVGEDIEDCFFYIGMQCSLSLNTICTCMIMVVIDYCMNSAITIQYRLANQMTSLQVLNYAKCDTEGIFSQKFSP